MCMYWRVCKLCRDYTMWLDNPQSETACHSMHPKYRFTTGEKKKNYGLYLKIKTETTGFEYISQRYSDL